MRSTAGGPPQAYATEEQLTALAASGIAVCPTLGGFNAAALMVGAPPQVTGLLADAGITPEQMVERRISLLRRMRTYGSDSFPVLTRASPPVRLTAGTPRR
jgi:hypothetical protein